MSSAAAVQSELRCKHGITSAAHRPPVLRWWVHLSLPRGCATSRMAQSRTCLDELSPARSSSLELHIDDKEDGRQQERNDAKHDDLVLDDALAHGTQHLPAAAEAQASRQGAVQQTLCSAASSSCPSHTQQQPCASSNVSQCITQPVWQNHHRSLPSSTLAHAAGRAHSLKASPCAPC